MNITAVLPVKRLIVSFLIALAVFIIGISGADEYLASYGSVMNVWFSELPYFLMIIIREGIWIFYVGFAGVAIYNLRKKDRRLWWVFFSYLFAEIVFSFILVRILKIGLGRPRPYFTGVDSWQFFSLDNAHNSFPSGHTADVASGYGIIDFFSRSFLLKYSGFILMVAVAAGRVIQHEHYLSDLALGGFIGYWGAQISAVIVARVFFK